MSKDDFMSTSRYNCSLCCALTTKMPRSLPWLRQHPLFAMLLMVILALLLFAQFSINAFVTGTYHVEPRLIETFYINDTSSSFRTGGEILARLRDGYRKMPLTAIQLYYNKTGLRSLFRFLSGAPKELPPCLFPPRNLVGQISVSYQSMSWKKLESLHTEVDPGGKWRPHNCTSPYRVAIIVPYRDRIDHLKIFLNHIHPFLQKQLIAYGIYVIEQDAYTPFNRGLLLNIGYREAMTDDTYDCAIFHDVDLLPENDKNLYTCPDQPRHMSVAVDELAYRLPYQGLFGGVEAFRNEHFELINGFSNAYFGWGGEDDDLFSRLKTGGLKLTRYSSKIARYSMLRHKKNTPNPARFKFLKSGRERHEMDGLNTLIYKRENFKKNKLFTRVYVRVNQTAIMDNINEFKKNDKPKNIRRIQVS